MTEKDKTGFLAAQIELAQKSISTWPKWLQEVSQVEESDTCDRSAGLPDHEAVNPADAPDHRQE